MVSLMPWCRDIGFLCAWDTIWACIHLAPLVGVLLDEGKADKLIYKTPLSKKMYDMFLLPGSVFPTFFLYACRDLSFSCSAQEIRLHTDKEFRCTFGLPSWSWPLPQKLPPNADSSRQRIHSSTDSFPA